MKLKINLNDFSSYALEKVYFYIESGFWSKPSVNQLHNWLNNFETSEEKYCALKLLDRFVYYSEDDIIHLIQYGINEKIVKRHILSLEQENGFSLSNDEIIAKKKEFLENTFFVPLNTGNLSQSSLTITRYLTIDLGVCETKILDTSKLKTDFLKKCKNLIILDDFVGSGKQISDFWNYEKANLDGVDIPFNELKTKFPNIELEYFCLVCTNEGYDNFKFDYEMGKRNDLRVTFSELLPNKFKIFGEDSVYFDSDELDYCKDILQNLCAKHNIPFLGYQSLDYAIAFHHSIPDCSLPLFYINTTSWSNLFRNKKTAPDV